MILGLTKRARSIQPSPTLALNALAKSMQKEGVDVVNLTVGETNFSTDETIQEAAIQAMKDGQTHYTPSHGIPELRKKIALWYKERWGLSYTSEQITVSCGVKQGLFNAMMTLVEEGDEVIIPAPYWVSYPTIVEFAGGKPVFVPTEPEDSFQIRPKDIESALTERTKVLILNSPNNPTGACQKQETLHSIANLLEGTQVLVISDEIYSELVYGEKFLSFASISQDAYDRTITMNGLSKSHAMTGWRVGFVAGPEPIIRAMGALQGQSVSNVTSFVQPAAQKALDLPKKKMEFLQTTMLSRRDAAFALLSEDKNIVLKKPEGAFYCFPDVSAYFGKKNPQWTIENSHALSKYLLEEALVATVPGSVFGEDRCLRISFAVDMNVLEKGIGRILSAFKKLNS